MEQKNERASLAANFERHADEEGKILAQYRVLSEKLGKGSLGFLVDLILTEEEMHHLLLRTTAKWLREPRVETAISRSEPGDRDALRAQTQDLLEHERETIAACRALKQTLPAEHAEVLGALLEAMALDSEKHHLLLSTVERLMAK